MSIGCHVPEMAVDLEEIKERILRSPIGRAIYFCWSAAKCLFFSAIEKDSFRAVGALLRYKRLLAGVDAARSSPLFEGITDNWINRCRISKGENEVLRAYRKSGESRDFVREFRGYGTDYMATLKYPRKNDRRERQGDLLLLKPYMGRCEKGVVFVQYSESFKKFVSLYDVGALASCYRIVLEPSTWGYQDPVFLMFAGIGTDVVVEAQYRQDYEFIRGLDANLLPVRIGAGDWVDPDIFRPVDGECKEYDLIMVASWLKLKRHDLLFAAMAEIGNAMGRVALVGYPLGNRTVDDIKRESERFGVGGKLEIFEKVPQEKVGEIIRKSRMGLMLSKREGANKSIYECLFSDVPVILSAGNVGVNRDHINECTGIVAEDRELARRIVYGLRRLDRFHPRRWALENTGYRSSTARLNGLLKEAAAAAGENWTKDIFSKKNFTNAMFVCEADRIEAEAGLAHLRRFLRK